MIYPVDKGNLDILRLLHFLALALLCWRWLPGNQSVLGASALRPLMRCGESSLAIYCLGVLLSFAGHAILALGWNNLVTQTLVSVAGIAILASAATLLARIDRTAGRHPRVF